MASGKRSESSARQGKPISPRSLRERISHVFILITTFGVMAVPLALLSFVLAIAAVMFALAPDRGPPVARHPDAEEGKGCGLIGNIVIKYDTADLFFPAVYEGVDYWGGEGRLNKTKWCDLALFLQLPRNML